MESNNIKSVNFIKDIPACNECPYTIINRDKKIELGKGLIQAKTAIVLGKYYKSKEIDHYNILKDVAKELNINLEDEYYITYLPKCYESSIIKYNPISKAISSCLYILIAELKHYCNYLNCIVICDTKLSNIISNDFSTSTYQHLFKILNDTLNIKLLDTPKNTKEFKEKFKQFIINDKHLGI